MHEDPPPAPERPDEPGSDELLAEADARQPDADELLADSEQEVENVRVPDGDEPDDAPDPEDPDEEER